MQSLSTCLPFVANSMTCDSKSCGIQTTPSSSATIQSPGSIVTAGNAVPGPCADIVNGTLTAAGWVKEDWPRVECPRENTGNPKVRCSAISLQRPEITTP